MPQKGKMIAVYPTLAEYKQIDAAAKKENRKLGPMVLEIVRRFFAGQEAGKDVQSKPAA